MSAIITSVVTGGSNSHATTVAEVNAFRSDFCSPGIVGVFTNTSGVAPSTGSYAVNQDASPDMGVTVTAGSAYITATPAGQLSQLLRAYMASNTTSYTISANSSGSTKYDWIYLSVDATKANNPASDASDVTSIYTSRSSSNTADNGTPPTYGLILAVVTVVNGASSISNASIQDRRSNAALTNSTASTFDLDYVRSGCVWSGDSYASTLNASMTGGYVRIGGVTLTVAPVTARAFTASKDTYVDLSNNGDGTAAFTYTTVSNNAASPALSAGAIRIAIIVTGAGNIAAAGSVNQGQESRVLPIASSIPYQVTDSIGNLICNRDPNSKLLGYRQTVADFSTSSATLVDITGLNFSCNIPTGRRIKISFAIPQYDTATAGTVAFGVVDVTGSSTITEPNSNPGNTIAQTIYYEQPYTVPSSGIRNFKLQVQTSAGTFHTNAAALGSGGPAHFKVELY